MRLCGLSCPDDFRSALRDAPDQAPGLRLVHPPDLVGAIADAQRADDMREAGVNRRRACRRRDRARKKAPA